MILFTLNTTKVQLNLKEIASSSDRLVSLNTTKVQLNPVTLEFYRSIHYFKYH